MVTTKKQLLEITQKSNKIISLSPQKKNYIQRKMARDEKMNRKTTRWTENNLKNGNLSVTLNVNGLNSPTKRLGVVEYIYF